ncbi:MAG: Bax inhibitor-1/YccA family protein [Lentisphaeria bacterium]|nr:Bax inhibitor-1/YccA family protein [Lentisphaeria bacterium]
MDQATGARVFVNRVYNWMFCGLMVTTVLAWAVAKYAVSSEAAMRSVIGLALPLMIVELVLVIVLSAAVKKMSAPVAGILFLAYSALNGVTLSPIFLAYTETSIFLAFGSCALMFAATSTFGYITGMKLDTVGSYCFMGLIGIIIASIVNFFLHSQMLDYIVCYAGVAIFVGLTAWDTQKVRMVGEAAGEEAQSDNMRKVAIIFALSLYLDFINLFLYLLRIFGRRR